MKNYVKIIILIAVSIGVIAGVLVFLKTRVAPPAKLKPVDQYAKALKENRKMLDTMSVFAESRDEYILLDDKLNRFVAENVVSPSYSDVYRMGIDNAFGDKTIAYGYSLLNKSAWNDDEINSVHATLLSLKNDVLQSGEKAVNDEFIKRANVLLGIIDDYHNALSLSRHTTYNGMNNVISTLKRAEQYRSKPYLKNNKALVNALNALPAKIAQSHYAYLKSNIMRLGNYQSVSEDYYDNVLTDQASKVLDEYKRASIYGNNRPACSELEELGKKLIIEAKIYYQDRRILKNYTKDK